MIKVLIILGVVAMGFGEEGDWYLGRGNKTTRKIKKKECSVSDDGE